MFEDMKDRVEYWLEDSQQSILYGLRYSGLTIRWWGSRCYGMLLDVIKCKMQRLHSSSISTSNRIWDERAELGQEDQEERDDQQAYTVTGPERAEESLTEVEEALIVGEFPYETDRPSEDVIQQ